MLEYREPLADTRDMYMVHTMFRREFGRLPGLVRDVADGDRERAKIIGSHLDLVNTILTHHHRGEDVHIWPRLVERSFSESCSVVGVMESQHADIDKLDARVTEAADTWYATASTADGAALAHGLDELLAAITEHLATEEELALPLIDRYITAAEWHRMVEEAAQGMPPEMLPLAFGVTTYEADPEVLEMVMSSMPEEVRAVLKPMADQAFAAHAELVYGTATPPRSTDM
jgi:iron-sulfur cluster repair protein YtfE (RIC family)